MPKEVTDLLLICSVLHDHRTEKTTSSLGVRWELEATAEVYHSEAIKSVCEGQTDSADRAKGTCDNIKVTGTQVYQRHQSG